jgi:hypothetical protein
LGCQPGSGVDYFRRLVEFLLHLVQIVQRAGELPPLKGIALLEKVGNFSPHPFYQRRNRRRVVCY